MRQIAANSNRDSSESVKTVGEIAAKRHTAAVYETDYVKIILPLLQETDIGAAGVIDEHGRLAGLLTDRAILRHIFARSSDRLIHAANVKKYIDDMLVDDVMIAKPDTLDDNLPVEDAAAIMLSRGFRFMPVVSRFDRSHFLGIVSERELAAYLRQKLEELKKIEGEQRSILSYMLCEPYGCGGRP